MLTEGQKSRRDAEVFASAFTLIELLVVIAIIGILAALPYAGNRVCQVPEQP